MRSGIDSNSIGQLQQRRREEEVRTALRALLMCPLMPPSHAEFSLVRRHADVLREWFDREAGWPLYVERDGARLYKRPAETRDASRGLPGYDRRRYVLLSLACAVLERSDSQITLRLLGDQLLTLAADPILQARGFSFSLTTHHERRELVSVCKTLLDHGVLTRVAGDEDAFVQGAAGEADALYDLHRRMLAGMLAAVRGPSTWPADALPISLDERLESLIQEHVLDSEEGRRTALRHSLARRLLDDPVIYLDELSHEERLYFANQRGPIATRLCAASGLAAEQRAEGVALVDAEGSLTDIAMPAEGTDAHVTLLIAERLSSDLRAQLADPESEILWPDLSTLAAYVAGIRDQFGRFWRRSAREPGSEADLASMAVSRLERLNLVRHVDGIVKPMPALARFALGDAQVQRLRDKDEPGPAAAQLFD